MGATRLKHIFAALTVGALALTVVTVAPAVAPAQAAPGPIVSMSSADVNYILGQTNAMRAAKGKPALKYSGAISTVSYNWSVKMSKSGFKHNPSYSTQIPKGWSHAGENVAYTCGYGKDSIKTIMTNWKNSPGHYANIVGDFDTIGIGVYVTGDCVYATQNFAKYGKASTTVKKPAAPAKTPAKTPAKAPAKTTVKKPAAPAKSPAKAPAKTTVKKPAVTKAPAKKPAVTNTSAKAPAVKAPAVKAPAKNAVTDHTAQYTNELAAAEKATTTAVKAQAAAQKSLLDAKKAVDTAKLYAVSAKATDTTQSEYKKVKAEYAAAEKNFNTLSEAVKQAKANQLALQKIAALGDSANVKSLTNSLETAAADAASYTGQIESANLSIIAHTAAVLKSLRPVSL